MKERGRQGWKKHGDIHTPAQNKTQRKTKATKKRCCFLFCFLTKIIPMASNHKAWEAKNIMPTKKIHTTTSLYVNQAGIKEDVQGVSKDLHGFRGTPKVK